jgi:hypothetical protein
MRTVLVASQKEPQTRSHLHPDLSMAITLPASCKSRKIVDVGQYLFAKSIRKALTKR